MCGEGEGGLTTDRASYISRKKNQNFAGFSGGKSQNSWKNRPISRDFSGKNSNFEGFSGQILRKIGRFHGGKLRQKTIRKKTADFAGFFWANFAKIDSIFASI